MDAEPASLPIKDFDETIAGLEQAIFIARRALASGLLPHYSARVITELAKDLKEGLHAYADRLPA